jgi:hypothetical protein
MIFNQPVSDLIIQRYSCRTYQTRPLSNNDRTQLELFIKSLKPGPFDTLPRFQIAAAKEGDTQELRGLGTYGFIKDPTGFIIGAANPGQNEVVDFGYLMECIILKATDLGVGTCWLGGTFTKSRFGSSMNLNENEYVPAAVSLGYPADQKAWLDQTSRIYAGSDRRLSWEEIFFQDHFDRPLDSARVDQYIEPLKKLRLSPSASNKQPWRILVVDNWFHFFIKRTRRYPPPVFNFFLNLADLQRMDVGIAMAHFELTAREHNLIGQWTSNPPELDIPDPLLEYCLSWYHN